MLMQHDGCEVPVVTQPAVIQWNMTAVYGAGFALPQLASQGMYTAGTQLPVPVVLPCQLSTSLTQFVQAYLSVRPFATQAYYSVTLFVVICPTSQPLFTISKNTNLGIGTKILLEEPTLKMQAAWERGKLGLFAFSFFAYNLGSL